jgi:hypothetical protein
MYLESALSSSRIDISSSQQSSFLSAEDLNDMELHESS